MKLCSPLLGCGLLSVCLLTACARDRVKDPIEDYLTAEGELTETLKIGWYQSVGGSSVSHWWKVQPDGQWVEYEERDGWDTKIDDGMRIHNKGKLRQEQLGRLAKELARYDIRHLPYHAGGSHRVHSMIRVQFGGNKVSICTDCSCLPPTIPEATQKLTVPERYAGILAAVPAAVKQP